MNLYMNRRHIGTLTHAEPDTRSPFGLDARVHLLLVPKSIEMHTLMRSTFDEGEPQHFSIRMPSGHSFLFAGGIITLEEEPDGDKQHCLSLEIKIYDKVRMRRPAITPTVHSPLPYQIK